MIPVNTIFGRGWRMDHSPFMLTCEAGQSPGDPGDYTNTAEFSIANAGKMCRVLFLLGYSEHCSESILHVYMFLNVFYMFL